jgi:hypothetical protein
MKFLIEKTWNDQLITDHSPVEIDLFFKENETNTKKDLNVKIKAPFFNDPKSPSVDIKPGDDFNLWDYEVVEIFLLDTNDNYLEMEFGP